MFLVNGYKANLYKYNRNLNTGFYDDEDIIQSKITICPYAAADTVKFGIYSHPEATGYYIVNGRYKPEVGDQIEIIQKDSAALIGKKLTILKVQDNWIFNRVENRIIAVK